jgi:uncharacterized membrane protein YedE/YeeE
MSTATISAPQSGAEYSIDYLFVGAAVLSTAILMALVLLDGQPASAALILGGFGLGIAFLKAEFSYTASWRRFLTKGEAGGLIGGLIVIAICALAVVPVAALSPKFGGAIAPLGPSLIIGAFVFGIGMQLANGCGSGTLYTVGGGSGRMLVTLAFFVIGSVFGSLSLPSFLALGGIDPVLASDYLGPWPASRSPPPSSSPSPKSAAPITGRAATTSSAASSLACSASAYSSLPAIRGA